MYCKCCPIGPFRLQLNASKESADVQRYCRDAKGHLGGLWGDFKFSVGPDKTTGRATSDNTTSTVGESKHASFGGDNLCRGL